MKKLISCLLAVLLVCSVMSMNVFANDLAADEVTVPGTNLVVGDKNNEGTINEGVGDPSGSADADIKVNFGQTTENGTTTDTPGSDNSSVIVHRYAVDITYGDLTLDLTNIPLGEDTDGDDTIDEDEKFYMVWDVNAHKYQLCRLVDGKYVIYADTNADGKVDEKDTTVAPSTALTTPYNLNGDVKITNHSDLSVYTEISLDNTAFTSISWKINSTIDGTKDSHVQTIAKATAGENGSNGSATDGAVYTFTATPNVADGWLSIIGELSNEASPVTTIGTITVTIAKEAPAATA